ncbi:MAG: metallophosphoesterase [Clostridiales bacterium]|nr:metallophosphoesterase [Clostridiales bacterium]
MVGKIFLVVYILIQTCIALITEYTVNHHKQVQELGKKTRIFRIIIYVALAVIPVLGAYLPHSSFKYWCMAFGNVWLAFFMYYSGLVLVFTAIAVLITKARKEMDSKFIGHALHFAFALALLISITGIIHAQDIHVVHYDIDSDVPCAEEDLRVVLLADLHLSCNSDPFMTEEMVELVNEQDADLIVIAGDIFTSNYLGLKEPDRYSDALSRMKARYGVYAVCGNHDVDENLFGGFCISPVSEAFRPEVMEQFFADAGFNMLYDESVEIADGAITLVGRIDGERAGDGTSNRMDEKTLLSGVDQTKPILVIQHEPNGFAPLASNGVDVVFCGHTHDGQIFPGNLIVPFFNENSHGVKAIDGMQTIVTSGVGYYGPPMRLGTNSEITVVDLHFNNSRGD